MNRARVQVSRQPIDIAQVPPAGTYRLDPVRSSITFTTRHMFGLAGVTGRFKPLSGGVTISDPTTSSWGWAEIDAGSIASGNSRRDQDVRSARFLNVEKYPRISFHSAETTRCGTGWRVRGQVTAAGRSAPVELTVDRASTDGMGILLHATAHVDRYSHGMTAARGMAGRYLKLSIIARLERA